MKYLCITAVTLILALNAQAQLCDTLFRPSDQLVAQNLLDPTWTSTAERDYTSMLVELGEIATPGEQRPEYLAGAMIYSYAIRHPAIDNQFLNIGFSTWEPAQRIAFPKTFSELVTKVQARNIAGTFKIATYNTSGWYRLDRPMPTGATTEVATDLPFLTYASIVASGYTPLWPGRSSLGLLHDLAHVTEYIEHPEVFPALQKFFRNVLIQVVFNKSSNSERHYRSRANFFNEISYILKPSMYSFVDSIMVTRGIELGSLSSHIIHLEKSLQTDRPATLAKIRDLTDAFDALFYRHGGGARDVFAIDKRLSEAIIEAYVNATKADPSTTPNDVNFPSDYLSEFIESPEGLKRQIQFISRRLESQPSDQLQNLLAYRVAQLEVAILTQRKLELSQVDVIHDSILPLGPSSKTSRYLHAYLPNDSALYQLYHQSASRPK